ncbi:MAG: amino acid permease [Verrucomicrobia bacterium]|nr:amino acid permease [Verrucomicrobiota bacterium]
MIVMGGIIGSGIFINPYVVAQQVHSALLIVGAWVAGGFIALAGAFIYAELSSYTSLSGGQYIYLRDAFHPALAFIYGWSLLLVTQTGGMAAVAVTFARYACDVTGVAANEQTIASLTGFVLLALTVVNCIGVRAGGTTQNLFMVLKLFGIALLVFAGLLMVKPASVFPAPVASSANTWNAITAFGAALIPVQFAYGGWQTACFVAGEVRRPEKTLPRALLLGIAGVIVVYVSVNFVCVRVLGPATLSHTATPASAVMQIALGRTGAKLIGIAIAISTLGFLSQSMLTAPRVYFAMAEDGLFFRSLARLNGARVPAVAIALQGALALIIALSGRYEQILNYVVSVDVVFFGLSAACLFAFRRRKVPSSFRVPGHPFTTLFFIAACSWLVFSTVARYPANSLIGLGIMLSGFPMYLFWNARASRARAAASDQGLARPAQSGSD